MCVCVSLCSRGGGSKYSLYIIMVYFNIMKDLNLLNVTFSKLDITDEIFFCIIFLDLLPLYYPFRSYSTLVKKVKKYTVNF